jgi:type IX secretion system PorP/SprF family membrane protein
MKRIIIAATIIISVIVVKAQQDPMYTQYMYNISTVNPAAIGINDNMSFMMVDRFQWTGFEGAPRTYSLSGDMPLSKYNSGVGFSYVYDKLGPERTNNLYFSYAYHIQLTKDIKMGMGLMAGFKVFSADLTGLVNQDEAIDDQFNKDIYGDFMPNFGLGLYVYRSDFYFGLSSPKLVNHKYEGTSNASGGEEQHIFLVGGYQFPINDDIVCKPAADVKFTNTGLASFDITANFVFREQIWGGLSYRSGDALSILAQIQINQNFRFGYAYDITLSQIRKASYGSHELMLRYELTSFRGKTKSFDRSEPKHKRKINWNIFNRKKLR